MNKKKIDFAAFILTHGRADKIITDDNLRRQGYTGPIYYIIDDEDKQADLYIEKYGDAVYQFHKKAVADLTDEGDNFDDRRTITHARNASYLITKKLGIKYFVQLDDDYQAFEFRLYKYSLPVKIKNLDAVFSAILDFLKSTKTACIAMAQGGDFIGGQNGTFSNNELARKCMNSFFCCTDNPVKFIGRLNEDVNTYLWRGNRGEVFFTIPDVSLVQKMTQSSAGGITEAYLEYGTYVKAFYSVMFCPSACKVGMMGSSNRRIHHQITWKNAVPKIISEDHKKPVLNP